MTFVDDQEGAGPFDAGIHAGGRVTSLWEGPYDGAGANAFAGVNVTTADPGDATVGPTQVLQGPFTHHSKPCC